MWSSVVSGDFTNAMVKAIDDNNLDEVKKLLPRLKSIYSHKYLKHCILDHSTRRPDIFEYLIERIDGDSKHHDDTLLMRYTCEYIFESPKENIAALILKHTKNVDIVDNNGRTTLIQLMQLITRTVDYNTDKYTPLKNIIKMLIDSGADPFIMDNSCESAIILAIGSYDLKISIDILGILFKTKHVGTIQAGHLYKLFKLHVHVEYIYDIIELLLPYIENINDKYENNTILWHAQKKNMNSDIIELLIENGAISI